MNRIQNNRKRRGGAAMVESALVMSATVMLLLGTIIVGLGVFRYQQIATLAREGARYATVHGAGYTRATGTASATPQNVYDNAIAPMAVGLDPQQLGYTVTWDDNNKEPVYLYDSSTNTFRRNRVTVTVTYNWVPEMFLGGMTLSSTSIMELYY